MWFQVLIIILFVIAVLVIHNILKIFVFSKIKVNKWVVLAGVLVSLVLGGVVSVFRSALLSYLFIFITAVLALWFMDLNGWAGDKTLIENDKAVKNQKTVIRPKAKPNRVKYVSEKEKLNNSKKKKK